LTRIVPRGPVTSTHSPQCAEPAHCAALMAAIASASVNSIEQLPTPEPK
jgi:hypothetical protein